MPRKISPPGSYDTITCWLNSMIVAQVGHWLITVKDSSKMWILSTKDRQLFFWGSVSLTLCRHVHHINFLCIKYSSVPRAISNVIYKKFLVDLIYLTITNQANPGLQDPVLSPAKLSETSHMDNWCNGFWAQPQNFCTNFQKPSEELLIARLVIIMHYKN